MKRLATTLTALGFSAFVGTAYAYTAVAFSNSTNKFGGSKNAATKNEAMAEAIGNCKRNGGGDDCTVFKISNSLGFASLHMGCAGGGCGVTATTGRATQEEAHALAKADCERQFAVKCKPIAEWVETVGSGETPPSQIAAVGSPKHINTTQVASSAQLAGTNTNRSKKGQYEGMTSCQILVEETAGIRNVEFKQSLGKYSDEDLKCLNEASSGGDQRLWQIAVTLYEEIEIRRNEKSKKEIEKYREWARKNPEEYRRRQAAFARKKPATEMSWSERVEEEGLRQRRYDNCMLSIEPYNCQRHLND